MNMRRWIWILLAVAPVWLTAASQWDNYKQRVLAHQDKIEGWCIKEKAIQMMELIHETRPQVCVEIGVFGGASIYPTAAALKFHKSGVVYAIDPWEKGDCLIGYEPGDPNYEWWSKVDYEQIYKGFEKMLKDFGLKPYCKTLRMTSAQAVAQFADESVDILHIDGNHSAETAMKDVELFYPKVKVGGYIWFDDANWSSTSQAVMALVVDCELVAERCIDVTGQQCLLFRKIG